MAGLASPDVPAYVCYAVVLLVGVLVARANVNELLAAYPDHWAFVGTWWLFLAYLVLPIGLLWVLDYTSALQDTSLFAALVVALGYRQIFVGGVQGITMPGQTPALWKPFEAWVRRVADQIATRTKQYRDRFDERVRSSIADDPDRLAKLEALAFERSSDAAALTTALTPFRVTPPPLGAARRVMDALWRDLRASEPENYGYLLYKRGLVPGWQYWRWLENGRSKLISTVVAVLVLLLLASGYAWMTSSSPDGIGHWQSVRLTYLQWRFLKPNASERDRWRSRESLVRALRGEQERAHAAATEAGRAAAANDPMKADRARQRVAESAVAQGAIIAPLLKELRFAEIQRREADDIVKLLVDTHSPIFNPVYVPELIESLRTRNENVRLQIHRALMTVQKADYSGFPIDPVLVRWVPAKEDGPGDVDGFVRLWLEWWQRIPRGSAGRPG